MICPDCGHGEFKHQTVCAGMHDGESCPGVKTCWKTIYGCRKVETVVWGFFSDSVYRCGCTFRFKPEEALLK